MGNKKRLYKTLGAIMTVFLLLSCTRKQDENSTIKFSLPTKMTSAKVGVFGTVDVLSHVIVNITMKDKPEPRFESWNADLDSPNPRVLNEDFVISDVPVGNEHLFQIIAVYVNPDSGFKSIYYGDTTANVSSPLLTLPISVSLVGNGEQIIDGQISGRYLTGTSEGPTGAVSIYLKPKPDKPALIVDRSAMYNGWFSFFSLTGVSLSYVLQGSTPTVLFGGDVNLDSPMFDPAENGGTNFSNRVRAYLPLNLAPKSNALLPQEPSIYVWGYWGPGASGRNVCTLGFTGNPSTTKIKKYAESNITASPGLIVDRQLSPLEMRPTAAALWDKGNPMAYIKINGGSDLIRDCGVFPDTDANRYVNFLKVSLNQIDDSRRDQVAGFKTFLHLDGALQPYSISGEPKVISGQVLPGILSEFDQISLFKRIGAEEYYMDTPNCEAIAGGANGFVPAGRTTIANDRKFTLNSSITSAEAASGVAAVLCLSKNEIFGKVGVYIPKNSFSGGFTQVLASDYDLTSHGFKIESNQCHRTIVQLKSGTNYSAYTDSPINFNASLSGVTGQVSLNPDCSSAATSISVTINPGESFKELFYTTSGGISGQLNLNSLGGFGAASRQVAISVSASPPVNMVSTFPNEMNMTPWECRRADLYFLYSSGSAMTTKTISDSLIANTISAPGIEVYPNDGCSGASLQSTALAISGEFSKRVYVKNTTGGTELSLKIGLVSNGISGTLIINPQPYADHVAVTASYPLPGSEFYSVGECVPLKVSALDSANNLVATSMSSSINVDLISSNAGDFFPTMTDCLVGSNPLGQKSQINLGPTFWSSSSGAVFKASVAGPNTFGINSSSLRVSMPSSNINLSKTFGSFNPSSLSNLTAWYKVNDDNIQSNATGVDIYPWGDLTSAGPYAKVSAPSATSPWKKLAFLGNAYYSKAALSISADFTIAFRFKFTTAPASDEGILQFQDTACAFSEFCGIRRDASGHMIYGTAFSTATNVLSNLDWHTVVLVRKNSGAELSIYLDDVQVIHETSLTAPYSSVYNSATLFVGKNYDGADKFFRGELGDILLFQADHEASRTDIHNYLRSKFPN